MRLTLPLLFLTAVMFVGANAAHAASSRRHNVATDPQTAYMAARGALAHVGFRVNGGSFSEREIDAFLVRGGAAGTVRIVATVKVRDGFSGNTDVAIQFSQVAADQDGNPVSKAKPTPLSDNSMADAFFQSVDDQLSNMRR